MANPHVGLVDARLNLLALLEGLVRAGALSSCSFILFAARVFDGGFLYPLNRIELQLI